MLPVQSAPQHEESSVEYTYSSDYSEDHIIQYDILDPFEVEAHRQRFRHRKVRPVTIQASRNADEEKAPAPIHQPDTQPEIHEQEPELADDEEDPHEEQEAPPPVPQIIEQIPPRVGEQVPQFPESVPQQVPEVPKFIILQGWFVDGIRCAITKSGCVKVKYLNPKFKQFNLNTNDPFYQPASNKFKINESRIWARFKRGVPEIMITFDFVRLFARIFAAVNNLHVPREVSRTIKGACWWLEHQYNLVDGFLQQHRVAVQINDHVYQLS